MSSSTFGFTRRALVHSARGNNQQRGLNSMGNGRYPLVNRGTGICLDSLGDRTISSATASPAGNAGLN